MEELIDFSGETAVITGGASDIAKATGRELAKEGANVVLSDIKDEEGHEAVDQIADNYGVETLYKHTDVSDYDACGELVDTVVDEFGGIDILVNVAAIAAPEQTAKRFLDETPEDWEKQTDITFIGHVNMIHNTLPVMIDQDDGGSIVNFCSEAYKGHVLDTRLGVYGAAKAGIASLTKSLASEMGEYNIRINAVSPSTTRTSAVADFLEQYGDQVIEQIPLGRFAEPEDPAYLVVFLASDAASWITGEVVSINGGSR